MKNVWVALLSSLIISPVVASPEHGHLTVYQDPNCGCCSGWVQHMESSGFSVTAIKTTDMASHKARLGVPPALGSCHTAVVSDTGQVIEGHVPANAVRKMLTDPSVKGVRRRECLPIHPVWACLMAIWLPLIFRAVRFHGIECVWLHGAAH
ncbi:MAG: DUF411 domain-containing protein, partial [Pusillimonas sp.]